jgi:hypothetical protein
MNHDYNKAIEYYENALSKNKEITELRIDLSKL